MLGLMSDQQLLISSLIEHSGKYHGQTEIVDCNTEGNLNKTNYSDTLIRVKKLANSLKNLNGWVWIVKNFCESMPLVWLF